MVAILGLANADHIEKDAQIINYQSDSHPDGSYQYAYETTNGIVGQEQGIGAVGASGSSQHVAPDGSIVKLSYTADHNGFIPQGSHVPLIPEAIIRSLEWNKAHPEEDNYLHPELDGAPPAHY